MIQRDIDADLNRVNEAGRSMARLAAMTIFVSRPTSHLELSGRSTTTSSRLRLFASVITAQALIALQSGCVRSAAAPVTPASI